VSHHLIYAVVHNVQPVTTDELGRKWGGTHTYLKTFEDMATFEWFRDSQDPTKGKEGHCAIVKWWRDRAPCAELQAIKQQYKESWIGP
jgi:hypothetical protein